MSKVNYYDLEPDECEGVLQEFYRAVAELNTPREVENFFKDLLFIGEAVMLARRVQIALMLLKGFTHQWIIETLKVGSTTIASVDKWLNKGFGGYRLLIRKAIRKQVKVDYSNDLGISFSSLRQKYPAHFWLINLLIDKK